MSHKAGGYFYYSYKYDCPWRDNTGKTGVDDTHHSAVYSAVQRQDHNDQTDWFKYKAMPAVKAEVEQNFYGDANRNRQGRTYDPYNQRYVKQIEFRPYTKLPAHGSGPGKGWPRGREI